MMVHLTDLADDGGGEVDVLERHAVEVDLELARRAIVLQAQIDTLSEELASVKGKLRLAALGRTKEILVEGVGKVHISAPFAGSEKTILVLNDERINTDPDLRQRLLDDEVIMHQIKKVSASVARVTIKTNI